jgi:hypothetical protein
VLCQKQKALRLNFFQDWAKPSHAMATLEQEMQAAVPLVPSGVRTHLPFSGAAQRQFGLAVPVHGKANGQIDAPGFASTKARSAQLTAMAGNGLCRAAQAIALASKWKVVAGAMYVSIVPS